jgi:carboxypeptidase family protein
VILRATAVLLCLAVGAAHAQRQTAARPSAVIGTVADSVGTPLNDAEVRLVVSGADAAVTRTGEDGRFIVTGELHGRTILQVRHLGFRSRDVELFFPRDTTRVLLIMLEPSQATLASVEVVDTAEAGEWLRQFTDRRKTNSFGHYFTQAEILKKQPRYLSELLRSLPGVTLMTSRGYGLVLRVRGCRYAPLVWVNNGRVPYAELDEVARIDDVAAMEVYLSQAGVPAQFLDRSNGGCGTIVIWTRQE